VPVEPLAPERIAEARRLFGERLEACWATFARPGEVMPELRVRTMRSRWGSLAASGRISLNAHLVRAPAGCLDYVIFHELCHLRVREHGPAFYAELARHVPEWKLRKRELRGVCI
ncbi:MAG: M48 family metallopeptidase, partial [Coriobacteriia bacterium]|nr:M48 family metallopeptidase [Coriobacteriia bacterium]